MALLCIKKLFENSTYFTLTTLWFSIFKQNLQNIRVSQLSFEILIKVSEETLLHLLVKIWNICKCESCNYLLILRSIWRQYTDFGHTWFGGPKYSLPLNKGDFAYWMLFFRFLECKNKTKSSFYYLKIEYKWLKHSEILASIKPNLVVFTETQQYGVEGT